jgi:hypothetical protein
MRKEAKILLISKVSYQESHPVKNLQREWLVKNQIMRKSEEEIRGWLKLKKIYLKINYIHYGLTILKR